MDSSYNMYIGGHTYSSYLSGIGGKKAFYAIYNSSVQIVEKKVIGTTSDYADVVACAYDPVSQYVVFLIDAPTLILFVDYLGTGAQGAIKLKNSSNIDVTDLDPQDHIEFYDN